MQGGNPGGISLAGANLRCANLTSIRGSGIIWTDADLTNAAFQDRDCGQWDCDR